MEKNNIDIIPGIDMLPERRATDYIDYLKSKIKKLEEENKDD